MINVSLFVKKNTLVYTSFTSSANTTPFTTVTDSAASFGVNEFKGHYVKINGFVAWIVSNTSTVLTLQSGIVVTGDTTYEIYRSDFQRLELFQDEKISVTSSLQNANDLGKIYTDYSQSFTIPASKSNNEILSHWYESSIDGGYDHRVRYDAYLEIDTHRFKDGNLQLEKASKKNGFVENYTVTFYGNLTQLKDKFKDTKLRDLSTWNSSNHVYNSTQVRNRITSATETEIMYPLIGSTKKYYYKNGVADQDITLTTAAVKWNELFPAITMTNVFAKIQAHFGITFTGSFFSLYQWTKLYLYLKNSELMQNQSPKLNIDFTSVTSLPELNLNSDELTNNWTWAAGLNRPTINIYLTITPSVGFTTIPYTIFVYRNGQEYRHFADLLGTQTVECEGVRKENDAATYVYTFAISSQSLLTFKPILKFQKSYLFGSWQYSNGYGYNTAGLSTLPDIQVQNYVPDITVDAFITGIIKAFNLMIIPTAKDTYEFIPLESYYNEGKTLDITEFVYSEEAEIERPKLYKAINFQYEKSSNILNNKFKGLYNTEYGDLIYTNDNSNESSNYDVKLPFENILFEKTVGENFLTASIIDKDLKPYTPKPILFYRNDRQSLSTPVVITTETGTATFSFYNRFSNEYNSIPTDLTYSHLNTMNFSNEQSPWYNVLAPQGLYYRHYKNFIDNLYNIKTRIVKIKAILPTSLLGSTVLNSALKPIGIALNDRLVIRNKRYLINNFTTDLTTGESSFELLTDYRGIDAKNSVGYRFASYGRVQVDATAQDVEEVIYLNDYDYFQVKGATNFLSYPISGLPEKSDLNLTVSIPLNDTGIDREDVVGIEYYTGGVLQVTEYITFLQQAEYLLTENFQIITTELDEPITLN